MQKREAQFGILFRHWILANPMPESCTFELKDTRGKKTFQFSELKEHQINYGLAIKNDKGTLIRVQGTNGEPDYVYFRKAPAYVVIKYPQGFVILDVIVFPILMQRFKNLNWTEACELAEKVVEL